MADLPEVPSTIENQAELEVIRRKFNIEEKRFWKGVNFVNYILEGYSKVKAYEAVSGCDTNTARKNAGSLHRAKWIQEVQRFLTPDENTLYTGEIKDIINANMAIIRDRGSSPREIAECTKALQPFIKIAKMELQIENEITVSQGQSTVERLNEQLKQLAGMGKMVSDTKDIIDVTPIE